MCIPSTGNRYLDIGVAAAASAITAGAATPAFSTSLGASTIGTVSATTAFTASSTALAATGGAIIGGVSALAYQALAPQQNLDPSQYTSFSYDRPFNAQQNTITGSGGAQAPALLASEIKRVKDARKRQESVGDTALNIESFDQTGLQLA